MASSAGQSGCPGHGARSDLGHACWGAPALAPRLLEVGGVSYRFAVLAVVMVLAAARAAQGGGQPGGKEAGQPRKPVSAFTRALSRAKRALNRRVLGARVKQLKALPRGALGR